MPSRAPHLRRPHPSYTTGARFDRRGRGGQRSTRDSSDNIGWLEPLVPRRGVCMRFWPGPFLHQCSPSWPAILGGFNELGARMSPIPQFSGICRELSSPSKLIPVSWRLGRLSISERAWNVFGPYVWVQDCRLGNPSTPNMAPEHSFELAILRQLPPRNPIKTTNQPRQEGPPNP